MQLKNDYGFTWGYAERSLPYVECGAGWIPMLEQLCEDICKVLDESKMSRNHFHVVQVKEKFGTLRFYFGAEVEEESVSKKIDELVTAAERKSGGICETCGKSGQLSVSGNYWYRTCCDASECNEDGRYKPVEEDE